MTQHPLRTWPALRTYDASHLRRIALPLGGIGTGTVSLGGRGDLRDWEVMNRPAKGFSPERAFVAIRVAGDPTGGQTVGDSTGGPAEPVVRAVQARIDPADYEGAFGSAVPDHGLPRFHAATFATAYPCAELRFTDPDVPVDVRLQAFNPLVPTDTDASGIPAAVLRYVVTNPTDAALEVTLAANLPNIVGDDGADRRTGNGGRSTRAAGNRNAVRRAPGLVGVYGDSPALTAQDPRAEQNGSLALVALVDDAATVTTRTSWAERSWGGALLDFWEDLRGDGRLDERSSDRDDPTGSVAVTRTLAPGATAAYTFLLTWHFPHRPAWDHDPGHEDVRSRATSIVGNHYATRWPDAWAVAVDLAESLPRLEEATLDFVGTFCASDLPDVVKEAALFNLSTLRSQTCFRTADGHFFGWEGCGDHVGSCFGSCTHVWNYEYATSHLFGALARSMREVEFAHATDDRGLMSFRVGQPLDTRARAWGLAAADGQLGCLVKLFREWRLSGDDAMLSRLWPAARRALEFCWIPGGWDADTDGVLEGCQHNTMDVEYYGPNPQMGGWYLAALRATEEMARHVGERAFADRCRALFARGSRWLDDHLFTGSYYRHEIRAAGSADAIAAGLRHPAMGARDLDDPELQLGDGCLVDQLVGQAAADLVGLGDLLDRDHVATTLDSIVRLNRRSGFDGHFNPMRSFVLGDETALRMCSYDEGARPTRPFPYADEVMTGFEYTAAIGLVYAGRTDEAVRVVRDIRERYDGWRRNPFDEAECGHHYARAMASWGMVLALTGFSYACHSGVMTLRGRDGATDFWSTGDAWGSARQHHDGDSLRTDVTVHGGEVRLTSVYLDGLGHCSADGPVPDVVRAGSTVSFGGRRSPREGA